MTALYKYGPFNNVLSFQLAKAFNIESHVLSPAETKKLYPLMNVEGLYGSVYSPSDGTIDPAGYCSALAKGARKRSGKVTKAFTLLLLADLKKSACRIVVCNPHFAILRLFQRSGTNWF